jgi:hypothetical protein
MTERGTVLSLFDHSGAWSGPWREAGYPVVRVDLQDGLDVMDIDRTWLDELCPIYAILAAPPCTHFAVSGARWFAQKDADGLTRQMIRLVTKTLAIIRYVDPVIWCLENPVGRMGRLVQQLPAKPRMYFNPADYAALADDPDSEQYTKKTGLWGRFIKPDAKTIGRDYSLPAVHGSKMWRLPPSPERAALRSVTPQGFARAFYMANRHWMTASVDQSYFDS